MLHVRDPRQAVLSWTHHLDSISKDKGSALWLDVVVPSLPKDYFDFPFERKLDWQIQHHLPHLMNWCEQWKSVIEKRTDDLFLLTTFEELAGDEQKMLKNMYDHLTSPRTKDLMQRSKI